MRNTSLLVGPAPENRKGVASVSRYVLDMHG